MAKKTCRKNNTYLIEGAAGDNPKLMGQSLSNGRDALYLEFYLGYESAVSRSGVAYKKARRKCERLGLYLWRAPRTSEERATNKEALALAKKIRFERSQSMLEDAEGYRLRLHRDVNLHDWMWNYYESYSKSSRRNMLLAIQAFRAFLAASPKFSRFKERMKPTDLTKEVVADFAAYLLGRYRGAGPYTTFTHFKMMIKAAVEADVLRRSPADGVSVKVDRMAIGKDVLTVEEVRRLAAISPEEVPPVIRRAFLFSLYTGLRFCDVSRITFAEVDFTGGMLRFDQAKTSGRSSSSFVTIPLNGGLLRLIGEPPTEEEGRSARIFELPCLQACQRKLGIWVKAAGIPKHITWHCARHSFALNILLAGADIKTVSSLLGHSSLSMTEKYLRAVDERKAAAINSLPPLPDPGD